MKLLQLGSAMDSDYCLFLMQQVQLRADVPLTWTVQSSLIIPDTGSQAGLTRTRTWMGDHQAIQGCNAEVGNSKPPQFISCLESIGLVSISCNLTALSTASTDLNILDHWVDKRCWATKSDRTTSESSSCVLSWCVPGQRVLFSPAVSASHPKGRSRKS